MRQGTDACLGKNALSREGSTAKAQKQVDVWGVGGTVRSLVWLEQVNDGVREGPEATSWKALDPTRTVSFVHTLGSPGRALSRGVKGPST